MVSLVRHVAGVGIATLLATAANATCPTFHTLTNGTTADASQVMDNFNYVLCSPNFTGPVGIGTTSPSSSLHVQVNQDGGTAAVVQNTNNTSNALALVAARAQNNNLMLYSLSDSYSRPYPGYHPGAVNLFGSATNGLNIISNNGLGTAGSGTGLIRFITDTSSGGVTSNTTGNDAETRMVITGTGNVGIGTESPGYLLHVNGTAYATGAAGALSDIRHKKNVTALKAGALDTVMKLRPVTFQWKKPKDDGMKGDQIGFIAQEVEKVLPSVVLTQSDTEKTKGLKYNEVTAVLTKALQEQQEEIRVLKTVAGRMKTANEGQAAEIEKLNTANRALKEGNVQFAARLARVEELLRNKAPQWTERRVAAKY